MAQKSSSHSRQSVPPGNPALGAPPRTQQRGVWAAIGILVVAIAAAYANSLHGPFVFDDIPSIVENSSIRQLASPVVLAPSPDAVTTVGRPLINLSLAINYAAGGLKVEGYHAVNLGIHILSTLVLFGLVRRTLRLPTVSHRFASASTGLALTIALCWAVHPLQTESVTYVVQRAEGLVGLFYLLTLYCFLRGATEKHGTRWHLGGAAACAAGMASKEVMVTAPLVALLYDRAFLSCSLREALARRRRWWIALAASWFLLALLVYLCQRRGESAGFGLGMTAWQYARRQLGCVVHYLRLVFWPNPLALDYGNAAVKDTSHVIPSLIGVVALLAATVVAVRRKPQLGFLLVSFFVILAPTSSIVPIPGQVEAEHRMYLPLAAVVSVVVCAAYRVAVGWSVGRRTLTVLVLLVTFAFAWQTNRRNTTYQSALELWDDTVRHCPLNYRAYHNRGNALMAIGRTEAAIEDFEKVVALNPRDPKAYNNLGDAYSLAGRPEAALKSYETAIRRKPDFANPYNGRGSALGNLGHVEQAIADFSVAIRLAPRLAEARYNRGNALQARGDLAAAIRDYDEAIALKPDYADAYKHRGGAHESDGRLDLAIKDYDRAITLDPTEAEIYNNRGNTYQAKGQYEAAVRDYDKAIALKPDLAVAYHNRAFAHAQVKAYDNAWADVQRFRSHGGTPDALLIETLTRESGRSE
jgi:protein O-mannosyl-transferase